MKLISWNVNGLRACAKKGFFEFINAQNADFICIQETKMQKEQSAFDFNDYHDFWNDAIKKGYSGTLTLAKQKPLYVYYSVNPKYEAPDGRDTEGRFVILEYAGFYLINVYAPNSQRGLTRLLYREAWQDDFTAYIKSLTKPIIICGDLNVAHTELDIENPASNKNNAGFTDIERAKMTELLSLGITDTFRYKNPNVTGAYTWWSYMANARARNIGWRIDYFLVSDTLKNKIINAGILPDIQGSDHCPITLDIELP